MSQVWVFCMNDFNNFLSYNKLLEAMHSDPRCDCNTRADYVVPASDVVVKGKEFTQCEQLELENK